MKIAYFLDLCQGLGGAGNLLLWYAKVMSDIYEVLVVVPSNKKGIANGEYVRRCKELGLNFVSCHYETAYEFYSVNYLDALESTVYVEEIIEKEKIEFIHSVQLNVAVEYVSRKLGIPHVMSSYSLKREEFRLCYGDLYPQFHLSDSELYSGLWAEEMGMESRCIRPVAPLVQKKHKNCIKKDGFCFAMLGWVHSAKNQLCAIQAIQALRKDYNIVLYLAGKINQTYFRECMDYIEKNELEEQIIFLDFIGDVSKILDKSDAIICTSIRESFPLSLVEAVTYDVPIIATPVAGIPEIFIDNYNAFISKGYSVNDVVHSIKDFIAASQNGNLNRIRKNMEISWKEYFSQDIVREQLNDYYQYIIKHFTCRKSEDTELKLQVNKTYEMIQPFFTVNQKLKTHVLYYTFLRKRIRKKKVYLWGAGNNGKIAWEMIRAFQLPIEVTAFIDRTKTEIDFCDVPIKKMEDVCFENDEYIFFICFYDKREQALQYLENKGLEYNKEIFYLP